MVKTKPREVFDVGMNASHDDDDDNDDDDGVGTYLENVPYNILMMHVMMQMTIMLGLELMKKEPFTIHH